MRPKILEIGLDHGFLIGGLKIHIYNLTKS
nr:MAG TPA: hypothetical protein [Inoviridae sp.]